MKRARGWIIAGAISILMAVAAYALQPHQDSPEHSSSSDAVNGASAAMLFAQAMGHPTDQITGSFNPPGPDGMMFVFTPTSPYTSDEAKRTLTWVQFGGVLVYASEQGDPELDRALGVARIAGYAAGKTDVATPVVADVHEVAGSDAVMPLEPSAAQVAFLRTTGGFAVGYVQRMQAGVAVVLADPLVICNGYLEKKDNGRLLADLLALASPNVRVAFDEYHHGLTLSDIAPQEWVTSPWGAALLWLLVAVFVGLVLRGRRFGPLIQREPDTPRSDVEWAVAVGQLLRRSSGRSVTLGLIANATERAVASYTGLPLQPRERFWQALWVRAPEVAAELADLENSLQTVSATEGGFMHAAQRLHRIAHPVTGTAK